MSSPIPHLRGLPPAVLGDLIVALRGERIRAAATSFTVNDAERLTRDPAMRAIVGGFLYVPW